MTALVLADVAQGVATVTLADEEHRNRLSADLLADLDAALDGVAADGSVRAVVLTAAGSVFCAGADLDDFGPDAPERLGRLLRKVASLPMPTIARVAGHAYGGGLGLIAACDMAIAQSGAKFAFAEVRLGVTPAVIAEHCLRVMRPRHAAQLMLTGERVDAQFMLEAGLLTRSASDVPELDELVSELVEAVRHGGPEAIAATKQVLREVPALGEAALAWAAELSAQRFGSAEAAEGIAAFRQRRLPDWAPKPP